MREGEEEDKEEPLASPLHPHLPFPSHLRLRLGTGSPFRLGFGFIFTPTGFCLEFYFPPQLALPTPPFICPQRTGHLGGGTE